MAFDEYLAISPPSSPWQPPSYSASLNSTFYSSIYRSDLAVFVWEGWSLNGEVTWMPGKCGQRTQENYRCDCDSKSPGNRKIWLGKKASLQWGKKANELGCVILWKASSFIPEAVGCTFIRAFLAPEDCVSMCQDYPWPYLV